MEEWVEIAKRLNDFDTITAVGAYHEMNQDKAAKIASVLGLPFNSIDTIENIRNKYKMRSILRDAGIDPTEGKEVKTYDDIKSFADNYGYPVVLKPIDGWASIGVSVISNESEIQNAIEWFETWASEYQMYVEQYLNGDEYSVEAFSENGEHRIICITQKFKETKHFVELGHCVPAQLDQSLNNSIHELVSKSLSSLGINYGGSHTEIIVTENGPKIVETHVRLGGDFIPDLIELASGIDLMDLWARQTLGEEVLKDFPEEIFWSTFAAIWYATPNAIGTLERIDGEDDAKSLPGIKRVEYFQTPGSKLIGMHDSFSRTAYVIATGQLFEEAVSRAKEATTKLKFLVSCQG